MNARRMLDADRAVERLHYLARVLRNEGSTRDAEQVERMIDAFEAALANEAKQMLAAGRGVSRLLTEGMGMC